jgi:hypothetical protein
MKKYLCGRINCLGRGRSRRHYLYSRTNGAVTHRVSAIADRHVHGLLEAA